MADPLTVIIGAGIISFIILYFSINQPDRHYLLKILGFFFVIYFLLFIPKTVNETAYGNCTWTINRTDAGVYDLYESCQIPHANTAQSFTRVLSLWWYLFVAYIVIYFLWYFFGDRVIAWLTKLKLFPSNRKIRGRSR